MGLFVGLILFGIPSAFIARAKGFASLRWCFALGVFGLITVACLASAEESNISDEEKANRANRGDTVGAWMCGATVALNAGLFLLVLFLH